jgi:hypothetical protein
MKVKIKSQPRIPGLHRVPKSGCFHPDVADCITNIAKSENKRFSYVIVEIVSDFFGVDCRTGEVLDHRKFRKGQ